MDLTRLQVGLAVLGCVAIVAGVTLAHGVATGLVVAGVVLVLLGAVLIDDGKGRGAE